MGGKNGGARGENGSKTRVGVQTFTECCLRLLSFQNRSRAFFETFISYLLGPNWKRWCDSVGFFLTLVVWLM